MIQSRIILRCYTILKDCCHTLVIASRDVVGKNQEDKITLGSIVKVSVSVLLFAIIISPLIPGVPPNCFNLVTQVGEKVAPTIFAASPSNKAFSTASYKSMYDFTVKDLDDKDVSLSKYRGNVVIVVNVASECGLTQSNYLQLNQLYDKFEKDGLRILAFPCNQFAGEEPGDRDQLKAFMKENKVRFDVFAKVEVNGDGTHPLFKYLKGAQPGSLVDDIEWNFSKFLVDSSGVPVKRYAPTHEPKDMEGDLVELLKNK